METNTLKLDVSKDFKVPVERLYKAWITEEDLKQWWHPMGNNLQELTNNLEQGGDIKYVFASESGEQNFTITGNYEEVKEGERLAYSWNWEVPAETLGSSQYRLTVLFTTQDSGSRLQVTQENFADEEAIQPHKEGWDKGLSDLQQYLSA